MDSFTVRRVYDGTSEDDDRGTRVLVDRLWPRGVSKERAHIDEWLKDVAPSAQVRSWYHRDDSRYEEFAARYGEELDDASHRAALEHLRQLAREDPVTLVTAVRDLEHSHIPTLLSHLEDKSHTGT